MLTPLTSRALNRRMAGAGLMRRPARGGGGGGSAPAAAQIRGMTGFAVGSYLQTANPAGIAGSTAFHVSALVRFTATGTAAFIMARTPGSVASGWMIQKIGAGIVFRVVNGAGTLVSSPSYTVVAGDVGKIMGIVGVYDGAAVRLYINRVEVASGTAATGYTGYSSRTVVGSWESNNTALTTGVLFGAGGGDGAPSLASVQSWHDLTKTAVAIQDMPTAGSDHLWPVTAASPIVDTIGVDNLSLVGSLTTALETPVWGW